MFFFVGGGEASPDDSPRVFTAQAVTLPSGVPPVPIMASTPVPGTQAAMAAATSPSRMNFVHAPAERVPPPVSLFDRLMRQAVARPRFHESPAPQGLWTSELFGGVLLALFVVSCR